MTPSDLTQVVRTIEDSIHLFSALPRDPELNESILAQIADLKKAREILLDAVGV